MKLFQDIYPSISTPNFENKIFHRKEFHDLRITKELEISRALKYQEFIRRFMSSHTPYNGIFICHKMGTGKSRTSYLTIEQLQNSGNYKRYVILTPNTLLLVNYRNEILLASPDKFAVDEQRGKSPQQIKRQVFAKINKTYQLDTFTTFYKKIVNHSNEKLRDLYSNCVFVIDEVHNLITDNQYDLYQEDPYLRIRNKQYREIFRMLHQIDNSKVMLMSGTPLSDKPYQIADIMNLILPLDNQMEVDANFTRQYLNPHLDGTFSLKETEEFNSFIRGRVSYLKSPRDPNVELKFVGTRLDVKFDNDEIKGDIVSLSTMSEFQSECYDRAFQLDQEEKKAFYLNSTQASMFCFLNGTWGDEGYKKYVVEKKGGLSSKGTSRFSFTKEFLGEFKGLSVEEKLVKLEKYSAKFAAAIRGIMKTRGKCFIFSRIVHGSGLIVFSLLLELILDYSRLLTPAANIAAAKRYVFFSMTVDQSITRTQSLLKFINESKNADGKYAKIILGSESISEGVTMKDVVRMDKLNPDWNETITEQSIARAYRLGSHSNLLKNRRPLTFYVYKHCNRPTANSKSIEEEMFIITQQKNISNKRIEHALKISAVDCALFYEKNYIDGGDYSVNCDYTLCSYSCLGMGELQKPYDEKIREDTITFYKYWAAEDIEKGIKYIRNIFSNQFVNYFEEFSENFPGTRESLLYTLKMIIDNRVILFDKYGFQSFLNEYNNFYYLTQDITLRPRDDVWYSENKIAVKIMPAEILLMDICLDRLKYIVKNFDQLSLEFKDNYFSSLPDNVTQLIIENVIKSQKKLEPLNNNFKDYVLNRFRNSIITKAGGRTMVTYRGFRCYEAGEWRNCSEEEESEVREKRVEEEKKIESLVNDFGVVGMIEEKTGKFKLKLSEQEEVSDKRKKLRGQDCKTTKKEKLLEYVRLLPLPPFENNVEARVEHYSSLTNAAICNEIKRWFERNNFMIKNE